MASWLRPQLRQLRSKFKNFDLLEKIAPVVKSEERHSVRQHPYVAAAAVVVRLGPFAILVVDRQDLVRHSVCMRCVVVCVRVEAWNSKRVLETWN